MLPLESKINNHIDELAQVLQSLNLMLSTAESCTGGWLAKYCTDLAGSSRWFDCGIVSYSNQAKQRLLGVQAETLNKYGAVSSHVAVEMAQGILSNSNANISVSITGIAGPDGGTNDKPVGTVWFAWQLENNSPITECHHFQGDRDTVRLQAVIVALKGIIKNARDSASYMG